ncbi:quinol:cytochrome C oxidoreductase [Cryomorpha ignava]|nr:quinol:cytochrome C oxidoreductase [Cryomorpha ignava]
MIIEFKDQEMNFVFSSRAKLVSYILMIVGAIAIIAGFFVYGENHHARWWSNMMINGFYFLGIALGALFFYALHFATETAWAVMLRRVMEAVFSFIPYASVVMIIVFIGSTFHWNHIYHWMDEATTMQYVTAASEGSAHPDYFYSLEAAEKAGADVMANPSYDELIANKTMYLNKPFFWIRTLIYLATFILFGNWFRKRSLKEDEVGGTEIHMKGYKRAAVYLVIFAVFSSTLSWDWLMSIDTHWFSTLYGWYVFSGMWVSAMNIITILTLYLISKGYLKEVNSSHLQDMGKWVFALSFLWSYLWFSQFMLIWYSNIPEEVTYFIVRINEYKVPFFGMFIVNFALPMVVLMSRDAKRNPGFLIAMGTIIFIGHYMDTFMLIVPGVMEKMAFGWLEVGFLLGFMGLFINRVFSSLAKAPLEPQKSPYLEESLHHSI